jgi:hypothetical protein
MSVPIYTRKKGSLGNYNFENPLKKRYSDFTLKQEKQIVLPKKKLSFNITKPKEEFVEKEFIEKFQEKHLEANLKKEDGQIKGFLFNLINKNETDEMIDYNYEVEAEKQKKRKSELLTFKRNSKIPAGSNGIGLKKTKTLDSKNFFQVNSKNHSDKISLEPKKKKTHKKSMIKKGHTLSTRTTVSDRENDEFDKKTTDSLLKYGNRGSKFKNIKKQLKRESKDSMNFTNSNKQEDNKSEINQILLDKNSSEISELFSNKSKSNSEILKERNLSSSSLKLNNYLTVEESSERSHENQNTETNLDNDVRILKSFNNVYDSISDYDEEDLILYQDKNDNNFLIIQPESQFKSIIDYILLIAMLYCVFVYPFRVSFKHTQKLYDFYYYLDSVVDVIFILDFFLNFLTPYYDWNDNLVFDKKGIFKNYIKKVGFYIDLSSSFPIVIFQAKGMGYLQNFIVILRFLRTLGKFKENKHKFAIDHQNMFFKFFFSDTQEARFFRNFTMFVIIIHIFTCIWVWLGLLPDNETMSLDSNGFPYYRASWITRQGFEIKGTMENPQTEFDIYICSLYFTLTTIYTIGYGDITSNNLTERFYNCIFMIVGVMIYSFAVSSFSIIIAKSDKATKKLEKRMLILNEITNEFRVPSSLVEKIKKNLNYNFKQNYSSFYQEKYKFLKSLPKNLKNEITFFIYNKHLKNMLFFREDFININFDFILSILPCILTVKMHKNEILFKMGDNVDETYIVKRGCLSLCVKESHMSIEVAQIKVNYNFGEILMYTSEPSPFDLKVSSSNAEMMVIKKDKFTKLKIKFPAIVSNIMKEGWKFYTFMLQRKDFILEHISQMDLLSLTDPNEIKKRVKQLKMNYFDGNEFIVTESQSKNSMENLYDFETENQTNKDESSNNFESIVKNKFQIDSQIVNLERNLDDELKMFKEIKTRRGSNMENIDLKNNLNIFQVTENLNNQKLDKNFNTENEIRNDFMTNNNSQNLENVMQPQLSDRNQLFRSKTIKFLENFQENNDPKNLKNKYGSSPVPTKKSILKSGNSDNLGTQFISHMSELNNLSKKSRAVTKNMNFNNIEKNITEHYESLDQNLNLDPIEKSKNKLIDIISQNEGLQKKLVKQETIIKKKFLRRPASNFGKPSENLPEKKSNFGLLLNFAQEIISNNIPKTDEIEDMQKETINKKISLKTNQQKNDQTKDDKILGLFKIKDMIINDTTSHNSSQVYIEQTQQHDPNKINLKNNPTGAPSTQNEKITIIVKQIDFMETLYKKVKNRVKK